MDLPLFFHPSAFSIWQVQQSAQGTSMPHSISEQLTIELINRARMDPAGEAARKGMALDQGLSPGTITPTPKQVLAPSAILEQAARSHAEWMRDTGTFSHKGVDNSTPGDRMQAAGYVFSGGWGWSENLAMWSSSRGVDAVAVIAEHDKGLYESPSHRRAMFDPALREVGVGQVVGTFQGTQTSLLAENFAFSGASRFVTGVAIRDLDGDLFYDPGEGRGGVALVADSGAQTVTQVAGGYGLAHAGDAPVTVTITAAGQTTRMQADLRSGNVKLDMLLDDAGQVLRLLTSGHLALVDGAVRDVAMLGIAHAPLTGGAGNDTLTGNAGHNRIEGGAGNDLIRGGAGNDTLIGGDGNDTLYGDAGYNQLNGASGNNLLHGGPLYDLVLGGTGHDTLHGNDGNDELRGLQGDDLIFGGNGSDTMIGNEGRDTLNGDGGSDMIFGGAGDDFINGGWGHDRLNGGPGADTFYHLGIRDHGSDWIQDYSAAEGDILQFGNAGAARADFLVQYAHTADGAGVRSGSPDIREAFVTWRPGNQIIWALVDGEGQDSIMVRVGGQTFDLLG
jgi:hypothetical protein